ncbi:hypothetical protein L207DRAFT_72046 [Hyaloscypha variabilis F]|uniref:Uncharacterized protein n=1 Tax=Hyaloscypha variabilis (strain UAMH 11265 / GT02V1 / F) TaxID=1149755 RepID=A0A2J6RFB1_HYAVF|nr:hypothetical protein L207DRAFT_72046 [Hyaloscypha variabilis F]
MFEVSWADPEKETVGERRSRKQNQQRSACASRDGPSVPSRGQTSRDGSSKPPEMKGFGRSWKEPTPRKVKGKQTNSSSSTLRLDGPKVSRRQANYAASSDSSFQETPRTSTTTTRTPDTEFFSDSYHSDHEHCRLSSQSEVSDSGTNSTCSLNSESINSSAKLVQHLSPTSFVTQKTEITVTPRELIKDSEQVAIMVHISASGSVHVNDNHDSTGRRPSTSQPAVLEFHHSTSRSPSPSPSNSSSDDLSLPFLHPSLPLPIQKPGLKPRPTTAKTPGPSPTWQPAPWEPPEAWGCVKATETESGKGEGEGNVRLPATFMTRGLGLPFGGGGMGDE